MPPTNSHPGPASQATAPTSGILPFRRPIPSKSSARMVVVCANAGCKLKAKALAARATRRRLNRVFVMVHASWVVPAILRGPQSIIHARNAPPRVVHHTDLGSQYASADDRADLGRSPAVPSMSRKEYCWDSAVSESFFRTLEDQRRCCCGRLHRWLLQRCSAPQDAPAHPSKRGKGGARVRYTWIAPTLPSPILPPRPRRQNS